MISITIILNNEIPVIIIAQDRILRNLIILNQENSGPPPDGIRATFETENVEITVLETFQGITLDIRRLETDDVRFYNVDNDETDHIIDDSDWQYPE